MANRKPKKTIHIRSAIFGQIKYNLKSRKTTLCEFTAPTEPIQEFKMRKLASVSEKGNLPQSSLGTPPVVLQISPDTALLHALD